MRRKVQFIWWGRGRWKIKLHSWAGSCLSFILDYSVILGPLEIRVWKHGVQPPSVSRR